jgi:hypothetical protein
VAVERGLGRPVLGGGSLCENARGQRRLRGSRQDFIVIQGHGEFCADSISRLRDLERGREIERSFLGIFHTGGSRASVYSLAAVHACDSNQQEFLTGVDSPRRRTLSTKYHVYENQSVGTKCRVLPINANISQ